MLKRWAKPAAGLLVTGAFVWLLLRGVDPGELLTALAGLSLPGVLLAVAVLASAYAVRIVRWWLMLRALEPGLPLSACVWPFLASVAVNNTLPFRAGDALRVLGFRRQLRSPSMRVLGTLVVERLLDLLALVGFLCFGLLGLPPGAFPDEFVTASAWLAGASLCAVLALIFLGPLLPGVVRAIADRPGFAARGWSEAVHRRGMTMVEALDLLRTPSRLALLLGLSILTWALEGAVFAVVALALDSGGAPRGPWFALATSTLATLLPSSPGYVGTFDYFAVLGMTAYGAGREAALAFALTVHAVLWVPLTALGLVYLLLRGGRIRRQPDARSVPAKE